MSTYTQLTYEQRCQISVLKKRHVCQRDIAEVIGVSPSTISRELKRNTGLRGYRHNQAQRLAESRKLSARQARITSNDWVRIEALVRQDWSPEQISGWLKAKELSVSHEWIYQYIWRDKRAGGDLYMHLRQQGKKRNKRSKEKAGRGYIKNRIGIEDRPLIVDTKARVGDWEIDTIIGKSHKGALVTITERLTKFELAGHSANKSAEAVTAISIELLKPFKQLVHTITADNGKEFAYHEQIAEALKTDVYFAAPYHSWQRGLNENQNGLLRQYFPKAQALDTVSKDEVLFAVNRLNHRPRKTLGFKTPADMMSEYIDLPDHLKRVALQS